MWWRRSGLFSTLGQVAILPPARRLRPAPSARFLERSNPVLRANEAHAALSLPYSGNPLLLLRGQTGGLRHFVRWGRFPSGLGRKSPSSMRSKSPEWT